MFDKLEKMLARFKELEELIGDSNVIADQERWQKLVKEHSGMEKSISLYLQYKKIVSDIEECEEIISSGEDKEMTLLAKEEHSFAMKEKERLTDELKIALLPVDPNDDKNVIVEVRPAAGGDESALFGAELVRMYMRFAERQRWKIKELDMNYNELGGVKEVTFMISGIGAYSMLKFESGVHRVQRVPATESQGRVHTSTCTVAVLPEQPEVNFEILDKDIKIDTYRSSGAGGQHVNKTDSAVRMTHIPTGIVVQCQNERSQIQNREQALKMLKSKLIERQEQERMEKDQELKGDLKKIEWGSQIRSYVFCPYTMVKDHRTNYETGNISAVMDGEIEEFIEEYLKKA